MHESPDAQSFFTEQPMPSRPRLSFATGGVLLAPALACSPPTPCEPAVETGLGAGSGDGEQAP
jgi:hypothetical protein